MSDEQTIRTLIENWVTAVHTGDLDGVLADHATDLVMFDVPPPYDGVRGLDAYRDTWPGFFEWQRSGAYFELESLDVTAGTDVAFAFALLHCRGADDDPARLLRLTIGLRKINDRWTVTHEHHSFPHESAEPDLKAVFDQWSAGTASGDLDALMEPIADDVVSYEVDGTYRGKAAVREVCAAGLAAASDPVTLEITSPSVESADDLAVAWSIDRVTADGAETTCRATRVFRKKGSGWQMIHQHLSYPVA